MKRIDWKNVFDKTINIFLTLFLITGGIIFEIFGINCFKNPLFVISKWKENHAWFYFETETGTQIFGVITFIVGCFLIIMGVYEFFMACRDEL